MKYQDFLQRVREHTGLASDEVVETAVRAVTEALGALIDPAHRESIIAQLPEPMAQTLRAAELDPDADASAFLRRVAKIEHLPPGFAVEHATAVLEALGAELHPEARRRFAALLPEEMRDWLEPRRVASRERGPEEREARDAKIAGGRPGSEHPVSESAPRREHADSVAASDDPHADTRLSSARGLTQEREQDDLAEGRR